MRAVHDTAAPNDTAVEKVLGVVFIKRMPIRKLSVALGWLDGDLEAVLRPMRDHNLITFVPKMSGPEVQITYQGRVFLNDRR